MKALILSGGKGTRLRPITHTSSKQLIPIANKPILFYGIEAMLEAGIRDIGIVVGDTKKEIIAAVDKWIAAKHANKGIKITYIEQEAPLGLAHAVKISRGFLKQDDFVMYLGDNLLMEGIVSLVREFEKNKPNAQILLVKVPNPQAFGVAELKDGKVVRLIEKPKNPPSDYALAGVYMFDKNIFEATEAIKPSFRNELEITDAIQYLIEKNFVVKPYMVTGWWKDTGKLEDILEANRIVLETISAKTEGEIDSKSKIEGKVILEKGSKIVNSTVRGPAIIGENTVITDSYIGPFSSIYHDVKIESSEIEHSIVLEFSKILNVSRIGDSLIGQNVEITKSDKKPTVYRIVVGDSSRVEL